MHCASRRGRTEKCRPRKRQNRERFVLLGQAEADLRRMREPTRKFRTWWAAISFDPDSLPGARGGILILSVPRSVLYSRMILLLDADDPALSYDTSLSKLSSRRDAESFG